MKQGTYNQLLEGLIGTVIGSHTGLYDVKQDRFVSVTLNKDNLYAVCSYLKWKRDNPDFINEFPCTFYYSETGKEGVPERVELNFETKRPPFQKVAKLEVIHKLYDFQRANKIRPNGSNFEEIPNGDMPLDTDISGYDYIFRLHGYIYGLSISTDTVNVESLKSYFEKHPISAPGVNSVY